MREAGTRPWIYLAKYSPAVRKHRHTGQILLYSCHKHLCSFCFPKNLQKISCFEYLFTFFLNSKHVNFNFTHCAEYMTDLCRPHHWNIINKNWYISCFLVPSILISFILVPTYYFGIWYLGIWYFGIWYPAKCWQEGYGSLRKDEQPRDKCNYSASKL